jgi:beta-lactamase regulating signal transducer with metallopeptidase domain
MGWKGRSAMVMTGSFLNIVTESVVSLRDSLLTASPELSRTAGAMLVTAIWQGAVVAACLTICLKLTNRISAALRFALWGAGFLAVVGLPFLPLLVHFGAGTASQPTMGLAEASGTPDPWLLLDIRWSIALTVVWAAASLYRLIDLVVHSVRLRKLWKSATPVELNTEIGSLLVARVPLRGRKPVEVCTTDALDRPSVIGFLMPRILIPTWLFGRLTQGELEQIVLHETEHLRRGDDWTNLLQKLSLIIFPLNPVLLWMERQLCLEREMACDEAVIRVTRAPRAYAACLASLAERGIERRTEALSLGAWQRRPELVRRVHRILRRRKALDPLGARSVLTVMACGLVFGTVELSRCPQLIAFTEAPAAETSASHPLAAQEIPVRMPFRMVDTRFIEPQQNAAPAGSKSAKPCPQESRSIRTVRSGNLFGTPGKYQRVDLSSAARKLSAQPSPETLAGVGPKPELLKAEAAGNAAVPAQEQQGQSWIVLTTWEEIDSPGLGAVQTDTAIDQHSGNAAGQTTERPSEQPAGQVKVTQLIFRVVPATSKSHMPTAVPVRGGWLVIQL